ncbi:MAG TPA: hypothetical protein VFD03_10395 [Clostridia bacterium]|nr:hypothetical protein [Clostridia bacterium]
MKFKKSIIALGIVFLMLTSIIAYAETGVTNQGIGKTTEEESLLLELSFPNEILILDVKCFLI